MPPVEMRCSVCGAAYLAVPHGVTTPNTCGAADCRRLAYNRRMRERKARKADRQRTCDFCGRPFAKWGDARRWPLTCSPACHDARDAAQKAARHSRRMIEEPDAVRIQREQERDRHRQRLASDPQFVARQLARHRAKSRRLAARERERRLLTDLLALESAAGDRPPAGDRDGGQ